MAKNAMLELRVVAPAKAVNTVAAPDKTGTMNLVEPAILTASDIASVRLSKEEPDSPRLVVAATQAGSQKLSQATANPAGMRLALVANGIVVGTANLHAPLTSEFEMSGAEIIENGEELIDSLTLPQQ